MFIILIALLVFPLKIVNIFIQVKYDFAPPTSNAALSKAFSLSTLGGNCAK